ncbi:nicotinate-nucleotide/dimethylbenzimidazole phosphoribosyltransferase, partial [Streptomyces zinciresistens K42]
MTDTGQVPGEGLPESAGMVEQPGAPVAHGSYSYLSETDTAAEDEDLLMPGSQGAWGNEVPPPSPETAHEPGPHEISGRDSGSVDLSGVRLPGQATPTAPTTPIPPITPRRPLHLGPPIPDASASPVRSLADRGAVGAPVRQTSAVAPVPEHPDATAPRPAAAWGAPVQVPAPVPVAAGAQTAETVVPAGVAQAVVARPATEPAVVPGTGAGDVPAPIEPVYAPQAPAAGEPAASAVPGAAGAPLPGGAEDPVAGQEPVGGEPVEVPAQVADAPLAQAPAAEAAPFPGAPAPGAARGEPFTEAPAAVGEQAPPDAGPPPQDAEP